MNRYLEPYIQSDLKEKMVFLGGPRQVGKTTVALNLLGNAKENYLNWDINEHRDSILRNELPPKGLLVLDEIHKNKSWRRFVKGLYDKSKISHYRPILVTGSARLDYYRFSGDSLQGRYHYHRLHPLSLAEIKSTSQKDLMSLFELGGFPEPFLKGAKISALRWSREYRNRLIRDDIIPIEEISDLTKMELLLMRLPDLVGSPLSINALREDLEVSHKTLKRWLDILERFYGIFRLEPFGGIKIKSVKKESKHYHFDWTLIQDSRFRFENMIASHLLKWVHFKQDTEALELELKFFRDTEQREIDFVLCQNSQPTHFIECKFADDSISKTLYFIKNKYPNANVIQLHLTGKKDFISPEGIRVMPAKSFLADLV
ncbi:MAG: AAA family ATPase [Oligoflexia bacterium]|nr:AAA family ATPase [Oligoflexia bacterium]